MGDISSVYNATFQCSNTKIVVISNPTKLKVGTVSIRPFIQTCYIFQCFKRPEFVPGTCMSRENEYIV